MASNSSLLSAISSATAATVSAKLPVAKAQQVKVPETKQVDGRRAALLGLAAVALTATAITPSAKADIIDEYLEKSKANKVLCSSSSVFCT
jgi:photosystem I subunit PsaN